MAHLATEPIIAVGCVAQERRAVQGILGHGLREGASTAAPLMTGTQELHHGDTENTEIGKGTSQMVRGASRRQSANISALQKMLHVCEAAKHRQWEGARPRPPPVRSGFRRDLRANVEIGLAIVESGRTGQVVLLPLG